MTYRFTVRLKEAECGPDTTSLAERIYARAKDATCSSRSGSVNVAFDRESPSLEQALRSAISDVIQAGSQVVSVELDQDDLAQLLAV